MLNKINKPSNKLKGLALGDDIRFTTGVARVIREVLINTIDTFDWIQIGGARIHPEPDKIGIYNEKIKIYPSKEGYGNPDFIKHIIEIEKPDFLFFVTDPRHFYPLFSIESDIRASIPMVYYNIWDNYPIPLYNYPFYKSCDTLICINRQTKDIIEQILSTKDKETRIISYAPHGVDSKNFRPRNLNTTDKKELFKKALGDTYATYKTIIESLKNKTSILWVGKNQHRKQPIDALWAFYEAGSIDSTFKDNTVFIMHTNPIMDEGTDLLTTKLHFDEIYGYRDVLFTGNGVLNDEELGELYNCADFFVNNSNAEGFGLPLLEAVFSGLPVIHTMTGGMQDQFPYKMIATKEGISRHNLTQTDEDISDIVEDDYKGKEWFIALFPDATTLTGSPLTPYIYEDRVSAHKISKSYLEMYKNLDIFKKNALTYGRPYVLERFTNKHMADAICSDIIETVKNFKPRKPVEFYEY